MKVLRSSKAKSLADAHNLVTPHSKNHHESSASQRVSALATIEQLLKLLGDHCKVCPTFAEEFEKLNL